MENKYLNIPNTKTNYDKVANTVATHMVEKCLTEEQIKAYAVQAIVDAYEKGLYTIGDLARLVKDTPADAGCRIPQPSEALYYGQYDSQGLDGYYFFTRAEDPAYNSLEVKEEVR
jgi:hypothetical protein